MIDEVSNSNLAAKDLICLHLKEKKEKLENELIKKQHVIDLKKDLWPSHIINDTEAAIQILKERIADVSRLIVPKNKNDSQRLQQMRKRKAVQLIKDNRIKRTKIGSQGAPRKIDDQDEEFLAECIEDKATYHGRRHNLVMYTNRQVKSRDLLNITNFRLLQKGKKLIKSATTVYNRCKPKSSCLIQASRHIGKGLMCFKKPPKAEDNENENTHFQRAHVKNVKMTLFSDTSKESKHYSFLHSIDDKAYIRPGTSEGFSGARNIKILSLDDASKAKKLPKYDWPQALVYQTPGLHRVMTKKSIKDKDGHEKLVTDIDNHTVFIRPKAIIGSSGSVWASGVVRLRHMKGSIFNVNEKLLDYPEYTNSFGTYCAMVHDFTYQYFDMTTKQDLKKISSDLNVKSKPFFINEQKRLEVLHNRLQLTNAKALEIENAMTNGEKTLLIDIIKPVVHKILAQKVDDAVENNSLK